jgi:hypothetical protein
VTALGLIQTFLLLWVAEAVGFVVVMVIQGRRDDRLERLRGQVRSRALVDMLTKINRSAKSPGADTTKVWVKK